MSVYRKPIKSRLELYVESYLRQNKFKLNTEQLNLLKKARALIEIKLITDCCDPDEPVYNLFTNHENQFTRTIENLLLNMGRHMYRVSLQRTIDMLTVVIDKTCCSPFTIQGFGGSEGNVCTGDTTSYFFTEDEVIGIGTALFSDIGLTVPVTFELLREDETGAVWLVEDGIITGTTELTCAFNYQVTNVVIGPSLITAVTADDAPLVYLGGVDFPLAESDSGQFTSNVFTPGLRTIKVTITSDVGAATLVSVFDSAVTLHTQPFTGNGVYTFPNVFVSGPNVDTFGIGISLE